MKAISKPRINLNAKNVFKFKKSAVPGLSDTTVPTTTTITTITTMAGL